MSTKKRPSKTKKTRKMKKTALSRRHVNKIFDWCVKAYGKSKHTRYLPDIQFRNREWVNDRMTIAFYDDQDEVIFIKRDEHTNIQQLANSIIHEYTHYLQNMKHYDILSLYLPYHKNPMEIEANRIANRDAKKCVREILED